MRYSIGDCLGEYGFQFYENLQEPIFLISKIGKIININHAGRKLLNIAKINAKQIEEFLKGSLNDCSELAIKKTTVIRTRNQKIHLKANHLPNSNFILVEIRR